MPKFLVAAYIRVSSKEQAKEGWSLDAQKTNLQAYADLKAWEIYDWYIDAGKTAGNLSKIRPEFQRLLSDARQKKFTIMAITKMDRAFRNTNQALDTLEEFQKLGVQFASLHESIDTTTSIWKFFFTVINAIAELERTLTVERLSDVLEEKFNQGVIIGKMPFGYKWDKKNRRAIIDEKDAAIVKKVFEDTLNGKGYNEICNEHKIAIKSYYNMIKNKSYSGFLSFNGEQKQGNHTAIIPLDTFNAVQELLRQRKGKNHK